MNQTRTANMTWSSPLVRWTTLTIFLALVAGAHGRTINVNLYRASGDDNFTRLRPGEIAGVVPVDGAHWNNIALPGGDLSGSQCQADQPLVDDRGNASAGHFRSTLTSTYVSDSGAKRSSGRDGNAALMGAYLAFDSPDDGKAPDGKGTVTVAPSATTAYTLRAANSGGETKTELLIGVGPPRPNIVYFFVDDMGWQDTSVPFHTEVTPLNKRYYTPNMAKLATQGMKFTQAYACAVCSPSRVSLMTGLNAARHGVTNWTLRKNRSPDRNHPKIQPPAWNLNGLSAEPGVARTVHAVTLPMLLRSAGYRTIHVGKAHFGARGTPGENPLNLGFDVNIAGHAAGGPGSYHGKNNFSAAFRNGDRIWDVPGLEQYHGKDVYLNEALTIEANEAVDQAVADGKPFYLYMSHYAVHAPWEQDDRFFEKYTEMGLQGLPAVFASMIESMDKSLGDILANLDRLGVADRTIVVFMTDNGCPSNLPRNLPLRGHKITPYEGGTRVPLIVKWPNVVKPGTTCNDYLVIEDIFPTFLDMAGVTKYEQIGGTIDGVSFVPLLKQEPPADPQRPIFWHFPNTYGEPPYSSVRKGDWKLIYHHADRRLELYNLKKDIGEKQDLAAGEPEKLREMADTLTKFLRSAKAPMPVDKTTGKTVEYPAEVL